MHHPRTEGRTKYNLIRIPKGFLDLIIVAFWQRYSHRPIHLFGGLGILTTLSGVLIGFYLVYLKFLVREPIADRPLLMLSILLIIVGIQSVIFGLIADILVKIYYSGEKKNYNIEEFLK